MRCTALSICLAALLALPSSVGAQLLFQETLEPRVDASHAPWQVNGDPLLIEGLVYYPSGPTRFFDPNVMVRTGVYRGVPVYQDRTLEPYSIVYVPIGNRLMRPYERRRVGELADTQGSRTPELPVSSSPIPDEWRAANAVGTTGAAAALPSAPANPFAALSLPAPPAPSTEPPPPPAPPGIETIPPPSGLNGMYIEFNGSRWFNSGAPRTYAADAFTPIGSDRGFPIYRLKGDTRDRIWVPVVAGGLLAQYSRR